MAGRLAKKLSVIVPDTQKLTGLNILSVPQGSNPSGCSKFQWQMFPRGAICIYAIRMRLPPENDVTTTPAAVLAEFHAGPELW